MQGGISRPVKRVDAPSKIGGYAPYIADLMFEGMLHARTLRSTRAHARILTIEMPDLPDGYFIIDRRDVTGRNRVKMIADDQPFFAEEVVNYIGEPILLVVGPDRERIDGLLSLIQVKYEDLEAAPDHCFVEYEIVKGDPAGAFDAAAETFEGEYETGYQEHIYMEPQGVIGTCELGRVTVYGSMQCPYYVKNALIQGLGWSEDRIRVVQTTTGGAFGGKEDYPSIIAGHVAFAALKAGRPVRLIFDRDEDILCTTKRHPSRIRIKSALGENCRVTCMEVDIVLDGGAYEGLSSVVLQRAMFASTGVYGIPNALVRGKVMRTNTVPTGAFRGFGGPQASFAVEMHMHSLAERLGEDPAEFKLRHALQLGDKTVTGGKVKQEVKMPEIVARVLEMSGYKRKRDDLLGRNGRPRGGRALPGRFRRDQVRRGVGVSLFYHGCAFTGSGEKDKIKAKVSLRKRRNGSVEILVSNVEFGQGSLTTLKKIVSQALGIPLESVVFENPDTDRVPDSGPTVASRTVMIVGGLLLRAAQELKAGWDRADELEVFKEYEQPGSVNWDQRTFSGDAYPVYSWGANVVEVEIDPATYEIKVKGVWGVYDVGRAIDESMLRGQMEGGISQGLGYATVEVMSSRGGALLQSSITDYVVPTAMDHPAVEIEFVENPYEHGPFGAKCAGELPFVGAAPALASAVQCALGVPVRKIPVTPENLLEALEGADPSHR